MKGVEATYYPLRDGLSFVIALCLNVQSFTFEISIAFIASKEVEIVLSAKEWESWCSALPLILSCLRQGTLPVEEQMTFTLNINASNMVMMLTADNKLEMKCKENIIQLSKANLENIRALKPVISVIVDELKVKKRVANLCVRNIMEEVYAEIYGEFKEFTDELQQFLSCLPLTSEQEIKGKLELKAYYNPRDRLYLDILIVYENELCTAIKEHVTGTCMVSKW